MLLPLNVTKSTPLKVAYPGSTLLVSVGEVPLKPIVPVPGLKSKVAPAPRVPRSRNVSVEGVAPFVMVTTPCPAVGVSRPRTSVLPPEKPT